MATKPPTSHVQSSCSEIFKISSRLPLLHHCSSMGPPQKMVHTNSQQINKRETKSVVWSEILTSRPKTLLVVVKKPL